MDLPHLRDLLLSGRHYRRSKGQVVQSYEEKRAFSYLRKGYVKRYLISKEGTMGVQSIYGPGYFFPLTAAYEALLDQQIYQGDEVYYYEAMNEVEIYTVTQEELREAAERNPYIYKEVLFEAGRRLQANIQQLENVALKDPYRRIAHQLAFYVSRFGVKHPEGIEISIPLTHQNVAEILNFNRETVSRNIGKLRDQDIITTNAHHVIIKDLAALKAIYS